MGGEAASLVRIFKQDECLRSIQRGDMSMRVLYDDDLLEVLIIEVAPRSSIEEPYLWSDPSMHLIVQGEVVFERGDRSYHLVRGDSIWLGDEEPYKILNLGQIKARLYSLLFRGARS